MALRQIATNKLLQLGATFEHEENPIWRQQICVIQLLNSSWKKELTETNVDRALRRQRRTALGTRGEGRGQI